MTEFAESDYLRLGGATAKRLVDDSVQRFTDQLTSGKSDILTTSELTTEFWNELEGT